MVQHADGHMGFDGAVGIARYPVGVFQDVLRLAETFVQIAFAGLAPMRDVGAPFGKEPGHMGIAVQIRMQQLRSFLEGLHLVQNCWQGLVFHFYEFSALLGGLRGAGNHSRYLLTHKAHFILGEDVAVFHVEAELEGEILAGENLIYSRHFERGAEIDALDDGVGLGAGYDLGVEQLGAEVYVVAVDSRSADLFPGIDADHVFADIFEVFHLSSRWAWAITASKMGV